MPRRNHIKPHKRFTANIPCGRKRRFSSESSALAAIQLTEFDSAIPVLSTYKCPYCNGWHLSSASSKGSSSAD